MDTTYERINRINRAKPKPKSSAWVKPALVILFIVGCVPTLFYALAMFSFAAQILFAAIGSL